ncbi:hypothetical protein CF326_g5129 [Tilletia indica]|uniref:Uncharacterized protein n=1 Tax=Tilletia indica TaxID=43049 RepID=A0A177T7S3_9BASI|nr:hypothetical protein CF326_g5129 [Tilletia indica]KAE8240929.1 hypothetical protein A4X13_0g7631 [Tilletia indica]
MSGAPRGSSAAVRAIEERHDKIRNLFIEHFPLLQTVRARALSELVPSLTASHKLPEERVRKLEEFLQDIPSLFRQAKRSKFHEENTLQALRETLQWRITSEVDNLDLDELHPLYVDPPSVARALRDAGGPSASPTTTEPIANRPPLFWINDRLKDHYGRPCGVISLRTLERTEEKNLENIKEYILASVEIIRRHIAELYARSDFMPDSVASTPLNSPAPDQGTFKNGSSSSSGAKQGTEGMDEDVIAGRPRSGPLQMVIACDLDGAGMSNLEIELVPFLLDLLKKHYPGHIAVLYLLHYGWVHAGMWTLAKRVLPQVVLDKIIFPKDDGTPLEEGGKRGDIEDHFDRRRWPRALGKCGAWVVSLDAAHNSVMRRYSSSVNKRPRSHSHSRHSSRSSSFVNLHTLGAFTPMDEKGNALGPWAAASADGRATPGSSAAGLGIVGAGSSLPGGDWGGGWAGGSANPPIRRRWRDLFRTLTYLFVLRILTLNRRMRRRVVDMGRVVGRSLVAGGQGEVDEQPERWSRHAAFTQGNSGKLSNGGGAGGPRRTGAHARLPQLQMSSNRLSPQLSSSPTSPGMRSPMGRSNVRYPTGWGQLGQPLRRDGSVGSIEGESGYGRLSTRAVWRNGMRYMRSFTLFALIVALFQSDWRTGMPKGPGMATLWDSVRAVAILGVGSAALRS